MEYGNTGAGVGVGLVVLLCGNCMVWRVFFCRERDAERGVWEKSPEGFKELEIRLLFSSSLQNLSGRLGSVAESLSAARRQLAVQFWSRRRHRYSAAQAPCGSPPVAPSQSAPWRVFRTPVPFGRHPLRTLAAKNAIRFAGTRPSLYPLLYAPPTPDSLLRRAVGFPLLLLAVLVLAHARRAPSSPRRRSRSLSVVFPLLLLLAPKENTGQRRKGG